MTNLEEYRKKIDEIDRTLIEKVDERMRVARALRNTSRTTTWKLWIRCGNGR